MKLIKNREPCLLKVWTGIGQGSCNWTPLKLSTSCSSVELQRTNHNSRENLLIIRIKRAVILFAVQQDLWRPKLPLKYLTKSTHLFLTVLPPNVSIQQTRDTSLLIQSDLQLTIFYQHRIGLFQYQCLLDPVLPCLVSHWLTYSWQCLTVGVGNGNKEKAFEMWLQS